MNKKIPITILLGLILFILLLSIYLGYKAFSINQATSILFSTENCQLQDLIDWSDMIEIESRSDNVDFNDINTYKQRIPGFPSQLSFLLPDIFASEEKLMVFSKKEYGLNLPSDIEFNAELESDQYIKSNVFDLKWADKNISCNIPLPPSEINETISIKGNLSDQEVEVLLQNKYKELFERIDSDPDTLPLYFEDGIYSKVPNYLILGKEIFSGFEITDLSILENVDVVNLNQDSYKLGFIILSKDDFSNQIDIIYSLSKDNYEFDLTQLNLVLLEYLKYKGITLKLVCSDCLLAPVSKQFSLNSNYNPNVSSINWSGGGNLTTVARSNLIEMLNDAKSQGINSTIISAYRSYSDQVATFNYWVGKEMANGLSRSQAEIKANNYSAYPGQSEHQLGNTVDIKCSGCGSFDNSSGNLTLYKFLKENAYRFGFVISYPDGKKNLTGYNSEPWHIRYVGIEAATKLFEKNYLENNDMYLTRFLVEYNYY